MHSALKEIGTFHREDADQPTVVFAGKGDSATDLSIRNEKPETSSHRLSSCPWDPAVSGSLWSLVVLRCFLAGVSLGYDFPIFSMRYLCRRRISASFRFAAFFSVGSHLKAESSSCTQRSSLPFFIASNLVSTLRRMYGCDGSTCSFEICPQGDVRWVIDCTPKAIIEYT